MEENKEKNCWGNLFIGALIVIAIWVVWAQVSGPEEPQQRNEVIASYPEAIYDVYVEIHAGKLNNNFRCWIDDEYEFDGTYLGEFNFSFLEIMEDETVTEHRGDQFQVQYRIKKPRIEQFYEDIERDEGFLNVMNNTNWRVMCRTDLISRDNGWSYEMWDNGKKVEGSLALYEQIRLRCYQKIPDNWECKWYLGFDERDLYWIADEANDLIIEEVLYYEG